MLTRFLKIYPCLIFLALAVPGLSFGLQKFDETAFHQAQEQGKSILLQFHASWCPSCAKQKRAMEVVLKQERFKNFAAFLIDYDTAKDLKKQFAIKSQATVVVLKGRSEITRAIFVTDEGALSELLAKALAP